MRFGAVGMIAFLFSKTGQYLLGALTALALLVAAYAYVDHNGYARAEVYYKGVIAAEHAALAEADANEQRRQTIANNASKQREAEAIAEIERKDAENLQLRRRLASESRQDPDADKPVLGARSVQRINQIR